MKRKQRIRENFRDGVFERDAYACKFCGATDNLDAHHITDRNDMPNGGYVRENGITVCPNCHLECEQFHITGGEEWIEGKHPDDLYDMIGSSLIIAVKKSRELC